MQRIAVLRGLNILDTAPEERFDRLTRLAKRLFDVPIAQVTLIDAERQWFKSGAENGCTETPRGFSFCAHAVLSDEVLLVADARQDERFSDNPLVTGDPLIRFYAGCPLKVDGHNLGTLCLIDDRPREFSPTELELLLDLGELARQELAAVQMANTDHLTGISNRRGFETLATRALAFCRRTNQPATLLYLDLDRFKHINDVHGHAAGDKALKTFARGLVSVFRESDILGRLGGDEFAVLMTATPIETAARGVSRLQEWIEDHHQQSNAHLLSFSAGRVEFDPVRHKTIEDLLLVADQAMYRHKNSAR